MTFKRYTYRIIRAGGRIDKPLATGTISGTSMEDAVIRLANRDGLKLRQNDQAIGYLGTVLDVDWVMDNTRVSVLIWAAPEYFLDSSVEKE